ncbi:hypothetical protein, conserved [Trypanosoma brucei brucei TREU927]|nr:hypothetical protein, conserved [Trypanosoma brucei brucei TREU927]EAN78234.1 hypothetical protein, conserved [Trypanosoma brucei brucei TREU927]
MEALRVQGLKFTFGVEFCRLALLRCFGELGSLYDVLLDVDVGEALVTYAESVSAQEAYIKMNGFLLFGETIRVSITVPPVSEVPGCSVTHRPSRFVIIRGATSLWVELNLRHVKGVEQHQIVGANAAVVSFANEHISTKIKRMFDG